jgi:L-asparaginase II
MTNPILVEVMRGHMVESRHRGAIAVVDSDGQLVLAMGDVERPVFPRSAVKAMQALALVESGAADACGLERADLALACASHSAEPAHVERARSMLARCGLDESALECGVHWPAERSVLVAMARTGAEPTAIHNNCSGKHAGFLCTCRHLGLPMKGYVGALHPFQEMVRETMEAVTGAPHGNDNRATDGCSIPTYAVPLSALARGFARMVSGRGLAPSRAQAARRLVEACMAEPFFVAGTGRACTELMQLAPGRIFVKTGAEGVYCGGLPELGFGFALKCDDGATRASEAMVAALLAKLLDFEPELAARLEAIANPELRNWRGTQVGAIRAAEPAG